MTRKAQVLRATGTPSGGGAACVRPVVGQSNQRSPHDPDYDATMKAYERVEKRYDKAFRKLARS